MITWRSLREYHLVGTEGLVPTRPILPSPTPSSPVRSSAWNFRFNIPGLCAVLRFVTNYVPLEPSRPSSHCTSGHVRMPKRSGVGCYGKAQITLKLRRSEGIEHREERVDQ